MDKLNNVIEFYVKTNKLKELIRSGWNKNNWDVLAPRLESVAEHTFGTCMLALVLDSEFNFNIDITKVLNMLIIHEIG